MSIQDCMVCDQCGTHVARFNERLDPRPGGLEKVLPTGWWTFKPVEGVEWLTFCGPVCVTRYIVKVSDTR